MSISPSNCPRTYLSISPVLGGYTPSTPVYRVHDVFSPKTHPSLGHTDAYTWFLYDRLWSQSVHNQFLNVVKFEYICILLKNTLLHICTDFSVQKYDLFQYICTDFSVQIIESKHTSHIFSVKYRSERSERTVRGDSVPPSPPLTLICRFAPANLHIKVDIEGNLRVNVKKP